jgi:hypothetical protein
LGFNAVAGLPIGVEIPTTRARGVRDGHEQQPNPHLLRDEGAEPARPHHRLGHPGDLARTRGRERAAENDIAVDDAEISRKHAHFVRTGKSYVVQNLNTSNGTIVNGEPITTKTLENRDVIRIAELELTFVQSAKDPRALGVKVEYASQLKGFPGPSVSSEDAEATMLGLVDSLPDDDEDFEVKPAGEFAYDLHGMEAGSGKAPAPRDLDRELEGFGLEDLDIPEEEPAKPAPRRAAKPQVWTLEDGANKSATLSLQLEILGLTAELRRALEGLMGKVIELPTLKIRIKSDDLG